MCVSCSSLARLSQGITLYNWPDKALVRSYVDNNLLLKAEQIHSELKWSFSFREWRAIMLPAFLILPRARTETITCYFRGSSAPTGPTRDGSGLAQQQESQASVNTWYEEEVRQCLCNILKWKGYTALGMNKGNH
jgi:hypothetical protein